mmetsp:Transcript_91563/g.238620  ORF Transcript_91563/g.238620 Transcript_91563/m.238620 type:complete len:95 (+) Transcript_91563:271-555(+)
MPRAPEAGPGETGLPAAGRAAIAAGPADCCSRLAPEVPDAVVEMPDMEFDGVKDLIAELEVAVVTADADFGASKPELSCCRIQLTHCSTGTPSA